MDPPSSSSEMDNVADAGAPNTAPAAFDNDSATVSLLSMAASSVIETVNERTPVSPLPKRAFRRHRCSRFCRPCRRPRGTARSPGPSAGALRTTETVTVGVDPSTSDPLYVVSENATAPPSSSSVIVTVILVTAPSVAPVALLSDRTAVSSDSTSLSGLAENVMFCDAPSPSAHVSVPVLPPVMSKSPASVADPPVTA